MPKTTTQQIETPNALRALGIEGKSAKFCHHYDQNCPAVTITPDEIITYDTVDPKATMQRFPKDKFLKQINQ